MDSFKKFVAKRALSDSLPKTHQVYELIRQAIISMHLPPGAPLVEKEICAELGISRTPLREAILNLATQNLVVIRPGGGTFVNRIVLRQVLQGQMVRDTLEVRLTRLAARNFTTEIAPDFELSLFQQSAAAKRRDVDAFFALDNEFHSLVCRCAGFPDAWQTIHMATGQLDRIRRHAFPTENTFDLVLDEHRQIYDRIKNHDEDGAEKAFQAQIDSIFPTIKVVKTSFPHMFDTDAVSVEDIR
ncbi:MULTISPECIES: GntR family transcriptional regulator [unclassified Mesorhizobium]|uniref:GntR family transcriptional regulator n=1 Tax=unclassified Mesorhizobium TaxID=325217 RepID=UPI0024150871|nr:MULTISPECIES: GntR family transcriptional regulator [unclassified Mesorhizobium]MDG4889974.1 GntR family transcriptional regulator [Mesorhizobium sp. WSM4887]MDG4904116.1 GntR family transcriptional regulator [Mesorhizobium sp. WSM4962]MDG4909143.1 GntR family transcriptional regulator [Mesorhizobium sp. WSM4898]MDG4921767.1 GntR family transcriptional regulator [Mesorhizobium sp. WSM4989]